MSLKKVMPTKQKKVLGIQASRLPASSWRGDVPWDHGEQASPGGGSQRYPWRGQGLTTASIPVSLARPQGDPAPLLPPGSQGGEQPGLPRVCETKPPLFPGELLSVKTQVLLCRWRHASGFCYRTKLGSRSTAAGWW